MTIVAAGSMDVKAQDQQIPARSMSNSPSISPELVGQIGGTITTIAWQNNYVYVGVGPRLFIMDISNLAQPTVIGYTEVFPSFINSVTVTGIYAYIADGVSGLYIVDISNPVTPKKIGYYDTPGSANDVVVAGNYAYVADGESGLRILNVTNPATPTEVGVYRSGMGDSNVSDVALAGDYAYIADYWWMRVIDITNPASPKETGNVEEIWNAIGGLAVAGNYAYYTAGGGERRVLRV